MPARVVAPVVPGAESVVDGGIGVDSTRRPAREDDKALAGVEVRFQFFVGVRGLGRDVEAVGKETLGD